MATGGAITTVSTYTRDKLLESYPVDAAKVHLPFTGADLERYRPRPRTETGVWIGTLCRLERHKTVVRLVSALQLDVFVMVGLARKRDVEGFGSVLLEANSASVPVVAACTGGVSDAVSPGVSGEFADPGDPADIAAQIAAELTARDGLSRSALLWAARFEGEAAAQRFYDLYRSPGSGRTTSQPRNG